MMVSLFSIFDPSVNSLFSGWFLFLLPSFLFFSYYSSFNVYLFMNNFLFSSLVSEYNSVLGSFNSKGVELFLFSGVFYIFLISFIALFPSVFTVSGHLLFSLGLSLVFWSSIIFFSNILNFSHFMSHLVPLGTPLALMSFMVLVELMSNLIRPITLSVRLAANMVAGHLLMGLLGGFLLGLSDLNLILASSLGLILTSLELVVTFIQGYVFLTLFTLYSEEAH